MTPERRAQLAVSLQGNELLKEIFSDYARELRESWVNTRPCDAEVREEIYRTVRTLEDLKDFFDAKLADCAGDGDK